MRIKNVFKSSAMKDIRILYLSYKFTLFELLCIWKADILPVYKICNVLWVW